MQIIIKKFYVYSDVKLEKLLNVRRTLIMTSYFNIYFFFLRSYNIRNMSLFTNKSSAYHYTFVLKNLYSRLLILLRI